MYIIDALYCACCWLGVAKVLPCPVVQVGMTADQITKYETLGYVMSGSRHSRMNAIRIRKENQVCPLPAMLAPLLSNPASCHSTACSSDIKSSTVRHKHYCTITRRDQGLVKPFCTCLKLPELLAGVHSRRESSVGNVQL